MPSVGPMSAGLRNVGNNSYYMILSTISPANYFQYTAPAGSGGAFGPATTASNFSLYNFALDGAGVNTSSLLTTGSVLRDMGKSVTASGSTFRKVQFLIPASFSTFGVGGNASGVTQVQGTKTGYGTGYIQVPSESGTTDDDFPRIARMF